MRYLLLVAALVASLYAQSEPDGGSSAPVATSSSTQESKRLFGVIPNYRTTGSFQDSQPIGAKAKFKLASQDSLDRGTFALAGVFAGIGLAGNSNPSFGKGGAGYGRYFGTGYADFFIGNYMTEAVFPSVLHQDPRYFRKGTGSGMSRLGYAASRIFITYGDNRKLQPNYSELLGNSTAVAISQAYYPDNRTAADAFSKLGTQLGVDMAGNIIKEFFPDLQRKFHRKH